MEFNTDSIPYNALARRFVSGGENLRVSRFFRAFSKNGLVAIFHLLHPYPIYISERTWRLICGGGELEQFGNLAGELVSSKLLVGSEDDDRRDLIETRTTALQILNRPTILYLMMSQGCNFACTYCPIPALSKKYGHGLLSYEDAIAGIRLWLGHIADLPQDNDPFYLIFYGGEPLQNKEVLERIVRFVRNEQHAGRIAVNLELMVCTNGSLITQEISRLFAEYNITVALGIDGPREHNDLLRLTSLGGPTYVEIRRGIQTLLECGVRVVASVTISPKNVGKLAEYPSFLRSIGISQFGFNLMKGRPLIDGLGDRSVEEYCSAAAKGVVRGLFDSQDGSDSSYEYQLGKRLSALRSGLPFPVDCTCYGNQIVIQADGQVGNCPFLRTDQGHVLDLPETFRINKTRVVRSWRERIPIFNDSILSGNSNGIPDGGGCAWGSFELYGSAIAKDTTNSTFSKEVLHELVWATLPEDRADSLRSGRANHWCHRWVWPL